MNQYTVEILIGLMSLLGSLIGAYSGFRLTAYRVEQLEKKVDMHNNFARRMPVLEEQISELKSMHSAQGTGHG